MRRHDLCTLQTEMQHHAQLDSILVPWAKRHGLFVATQHMDEEVRSIQIVDDSGASYQLWVELSHANSSVCVSIAEHEGPSRNRRKQTFSTNLEELDQTLEQAFSVAEIWIHQRGNTRNPIL